MRVGEGTVRKWRFRKCRTRQGWSGLWSPTLSFYLHGKGFVSFEDEGPSESKNVHYLASIDPPGDSVGLPPFLLLRTRHKRRNRHHSVQGDLEVSLGRDDV